MIYISQRLTSGFDHRDPGLKEMWLDCSWRQKSDLVPALIGPRPTFQQAIEFLQPDPYGRCSYLAARFFIFYPGYFMLLDGFKATHGDEQFGVPLFPDDWPKKAAPIGEPLFEGSFRILDPKKAEIHFYARPRDHLATSSYPRYSPFPLIFDLQCWKYWEATFYYNSKLLNAWGEYGSAA